MKLIATALDQEGKIEFYEEKEKGTSAAKFSGRPSLTKVAIQYSKTREGKKIATYGRTRLLKTSNKSEAVCAGKLQGLYGQHEEKYFDYFVFNIVDCGVNCGLLRSGAYRRVRAQPAQPIGKARGLDINSPLSAENHPQDLQFRRHQQHDNLNNARGLDNNFASDLGYDSTTTTRLRHRRVRRADHAAPDKS
jgi:hypothetical protein